MRKIKWWLETGFVGCGHDGEFEVKNDATDDEIEDEAKDAAFDRISWGWSELKPTGEDIGDG